ncbi:hypothetical protein ZIOFF_004828 [Zingiber officinale]|uniref:Reverse transcriptase Ty1/copia-type domain-containing protein n=1 Tax=Zingiber officinale TaxID=94328 RepID=A0A8J5M3Z1_ZINOF|nr:hypothetical protein ZIOFF_004828 [Zingiber officinale]
MILFGFKQGNADHTLFIKRKGDNTTILLVYVDDMIVTGDDEVEIQALKSKLTSEFEIKDLGSLKYFLGIEVPRSKKGIYVCQRKCVLDLLKETGKLGSRPASTPIEVNHDLTSSSGEDLTSLEKGTYQRLVGKLLYLSMTRPDITYAVSVVSQYMHAPKTIHMKAVDRILRHLKSCPEKGLLFKGGGDLKVECYSDADWAGSRDDRRSTSGYCTFLGGNLVTWRSKKQNVCARSSAEAEYRAMAHGLAEMLWLSFLLTNIGLKVELPLRLYCDNKAAINIANNLVQHDRTKHIEIDRHFIRERLDSGELCLPYVKSEDQLVDMFTKVISQAVFDSSLSKLNMFDIYVQLEGECCEKQG